VDISGGQSVISPNSSEEEYDDEDGIVMIVRNLRKLINSKGDPKGAE
jgi:hypothetical protein